MSRLEHALQALETALAPLLDALGRELVGANLESTFAQVEQAFRAVRTELEQQPEERATVAPQLERCLRLHAVALGMLESGREALARERTTCTQARARLERLQVGASGTSCDLSA